MGFEPMKNGFANRPLRPLGYRTAIDLLRNFSRRIPFNQDIRDRTSSGAAIILRHTWYNIAMKRIIILLITAIAIASPLAASSQYATVSVAGGYTSTTRSAIIGAGANYGYLSDVSRFVGIGFGSHLDFAFVNSHYGGFSFGALVGADFEFRPAERATIALIVGPGFTAHADYGSYVGFGIGADISFSYYFGGDMNTGIVVGATVYPQFASWDEYGRRPFDIIASGYFGVSFRFRGYSYNQLIPDPLPFILI